MLMYCPDRNARGAPSMRRKTKTIIPPASGMVSTHSAVNSCGCQGPSAVAAPAGSEVLESTRFQGISSPRTR